MTGTNTLTGETHMKNKQRGVVSLAIFVVIALVGLGWSMTTKQPGTFVPVVERGCTVVYDTRTAERVSSSCEKATQK